MLLLVVGFLPIPTKIVAQALRDVNGERVFVTMYGLTLLTIRLFGFALDAYARHEHLYESGPADDELQTERRDIWPTVAAYLTAVLIGLALPMVAVALYLALAVFLVVPWRELRLVLRRS
jgi:hypothetical protein